MAAIIAALIIAVFTSGIGWLLVGSRFAFDADDRQNDILNLGFYLGASFLVALVSIFLITG